MNLEVSQKQFKISAFQISLMIHGFIIFVLVVFFFDFGVFSKSKKINFEVIENPVLAKPNLVLQPRNEVKPKVVKPLPESTQKVFGLSRKSITTSDASRRTVEVKAGNTVAKENDDLKLKPTDADSLPIPADDYLVTSMPKLVSVVTANRTDEARKAGYTGSAVILLLIDKNGDVREAKILNQLEYGLSEKALEIAKKLKFIPAKIKDEAVATKIRFSINFKSSN